ncbi:MAG: putative lipoprotein, partial [Frankiales bacterium]|nr:putative lipoprotein [Frankiales bacterium]
TVRRTRTRALLLAALLASAAAAAGCDEREATAALPSAGAPPSVAAPPVEAPGRPVLTVAALGDSYTQGFSSCGRLGNCPTYSWATGTAAAVPSLLERLAGASGADAVGQNLSVSGARVGALNRQAVRAGFTRAGLVTVLVGVNDVCTSDLASMTPVPQFRTELERAFTTLDRTSPSARLLVLSVPDLGRMADLGRDVPAARASWRRHDVCRPVFDRGTPPRPDSALRLATDDRRRAFDGVLEAACRSRPRCTWDGGALAGLRFDAGFLSPDWFHPSARGQRQIAALAARVLGGRVGPAGVEPALGRP